MRNGIRSWIGQFIRSIHKNRSITTNDSDSSRLINSLQGFTGIYDGKNHSISLVTADNCKIEYSTDQSNWGPDAPFICNAGKCEVYVKVSRNRRVETGSEEINIQKRNIILTSSSVTKEYDGIPIKDSEVTIAGEGLLEGDVINVHAVGEQHLVGKCTNTIEYQFADNVVVENYHVIKEEGTLEILDREEKYSVEVKGKDAEYKYDGTDHEVGGFENLLFSFNSVEFYVRGVDSYASLKHAGEITTTISGAYTVVDANGNDVSDQFNVTIVPGKLSVTPRMVLIKSASDSQEYNGRELHNDNIDILGDGFVAGDAPVIIVTGKQRLVGSSQNYYEYTFPEYVVSDDYLVSVEYGNFEVVDRKEKYSVDIHMNSGEFIYDAQEHVLSGIEENTVLIDGNQYVIEVEDVPANGINAGNYEHETVNSVRIYDYEHCDVSSQFDIHIYPGTLSVKKRDLVLKSSSAVKEYDGSPLTNSSIQIMGAGLAEGDKISGFADGTQLIVGKSRNSISYYFHRSELENNYNVVLDEGSLEVISRKIKLFITLEANSADYMYDGSVHTVSGFHSNTAVMNENEFTVSGINAQASLLHTGSAETEITGKAIVTDSYGNDVSDQFDIFIIPGTLRIHPRRVAITSSSASKEYDGMVLTATDVRIMGEGFVSNETPSIVVLGKQRLVGNSKNLFTYTFPTSAQSADYQISVRYGTLRVYNRQIKYGLEIHLNSGEFYYDANEHIVSGIEEKAVQVEGSTFYPIVSDQPVHAVNAGIYTHDKVDSIRILDTERCDVTEQFDIHLYPGTLTIKKRDLILKSYSAIKEYDGIPLTDASVQISGLANGDRIEGFAVGSQLTVGKSRNSISYMFYMDVLGDNYNIILDEGTLEVTDRKEKFKAVLKAKSAEYTYDGKIHSINELLGNTVIINRKVFNITGIHVYVSQRHAGNSETMISGSAIVTDAMGNNVTDQFDVEVIPGTITIKPRYVELTSSSASREYNGSVLRCDDIWISGEGFIEGEEPSFVVTGEQRLVGSSTNHFEYTFPKHVAPYDYWVSVEYGDLEVLDRKNKYSIDVRLNNGIFKYDAMEHVAAGIEENTVIIDGNSYTVDVLDEPARGIHTGNYIHDTVNEVRVYDDEQHDVSEQFEVGVAPGTLYIYPRYVKISSASSSKEYDGTELTASEIEIFGDGFAPGEEPSVVVSGKQKLLGVSDNIFSFTLPDSVNKKDYLITSEYGKLEVLNRTVQYFMDVHLRDADFMYDSNEHVVSGAVEKEIAIDGNTFELAVVDEPVAGTEPGEYKHDKVKSISVFDEDKNDVTDQFNIHIHPGKLTIQPNPEYSVPEEEKIDDYDVAIHSILNVMSGGKLSDSLDGIKKYSRKELEALYEDKKELIISDGKVLPFCEYLLEKKEGNSDLVKLHNRIVDEIQDVVLLSEIEINDSEYRTLIDYARKKFKTVQINPNYSFADVLFSIAMIQIGVRKYAYNYWPQVEDELGRTVGFNERKWLGNTVNRTLISLGKPIYSEPEYVTNILMHCIVTDSYALRFFDYLFSYYRLDLERDISGMQKTDIDYICDSIINPYSKRKQLLSEYLSMSIRADKENCSAMIQKSLYMIDHCFWDEEMSEEESLKGRMRERFNEWLEQSQFYEFEKKKNKHRIVNGKRERLFRTPHLKVDLYKKEFVLVLPQQMIPTREETENLEVKWFIVSDNNREFNCRLEEGYSGYKTQEIRVYINPKEIFEKIVFLLFADKKLIRSFSWEEHKAAFFTDSLDWVSGSKLDAGKIYAFCQPKCRIESRNLLYQGWFIGLHYYEFDLKEGDFVIVPGEDNYYVGKVPTPGLGEEGIVKDVSITYENNQNLPIYSRDPQLIVEVEEEQLPGTAIITNGKISRLKDIKYVDVHVGNTSDIKYYFVSSRNLKGVREGYNKIIVDYPNSQKQVILEYYKSTGFFYKFDGAPYVFEDKGTLVFMGRETVEFSMSTLEDGVLEVILEDEGTLYFKVPMLLTSWDRVNWSYKKRHDKWHDDLKNMIYIRYPASTISLFVDGDYKDISRCSFNVMSDGIFNCDMTKLKSYFSKTAMLDRIFFEAGEIKTRLFRIVLRSYFAGLKMSADSRNNKIRASLKIIGKNDYYADLYCEDVLLSEKEPVENGTVTFDDIEIETADYTIKLYESEGDFGFDDDYSFVGKRTCSLINVSDLLGGRMKILSIITSDSNELTFNAEYNYYVFPEKLIGDNSYEAIVSGVFHNESVMYASRVLVEIKDITNPERVTVSKINLGGEEYGLAYDKEKEAIIDCRMKHRDKKGRLYLDPALCDWKVEFIGGNARLLKLSRTKMEETEKQRNKPFTIWKN